jgi:purine-binding chemotaxis protein CheW
MTRPPGAGGIDWEEPKRRPREELGKREGQPAYDREKARRILRTRALRLARAPAASPAPGEIIEVVELVLASERFAFETVWMREIVPLRELTALPGTPQFVAGLVAVRGQILSVIDLKKFFDLPARGLGDLDKVLILRGRDMELGVLADAVVGVRAVARAEIKPAPPTLIGIRAEYLLGVTPDHLVVLDGGRLLADQRLVVEEDSKV